MNHISRAEFEKIVAEEFEGIPEEWAERLHNVALLVEDEPSPATRRAEGLRQNQTLLGLYQGVPASHRDTSYGIGPTLPDSITLYMRPILAAAGAPERVREVVRETIWHEVAHYLGFSEAEVRKREREASNYFKRKNKKD